MFGVTPARSLPLLSYGLFASRDAVTIGASFNAPEVMSTYLRRIGIVHEKRTADNIAQLMCPAAAQLLSAPLYLIGLDLYNRPEATGPQRLGLIRKEYFKTVMARIARIAPAFGIGGITNSKIRGFRQRVLDQNEL